MIDYASVEELRGYVRIGDELDDVYLALCLTAASRAVDRSCNRNFNTQLEDAELRYFVPDVTGVEIDDLFTADDLTVSGSGEFHLAPRNAASKGDPYTALVGRFRETVEVTAKWGWPTVPSTIKLATLLQASRLVARRDSPFGVAGSPEMGSEIRLLDKVDPDVAVMLRSYRRIWTVVPKPVTNYGLWVTPDTSVWG